MSSAQSLLAQQLQFTSPRRTLGDTPGTVRITDLSGGFDDQKAELYFGDPLTFPTYWDSQNINVWDHPSQAFLCSQWNRIGAPEGADHEYLLYPFNTAVYRFTTVNHDAALCQKVTAATGAISAWTSLANIYPGATAFRNGIEWRGSFYIASGENLLRIMSSTETWSTLAAPGAVGGALAGQVGVGVDDKLVVWWESNGLYTYDGTSWVKIFPATAGVVSNDPYCDLIFMGPGSLMFLTRSLTGTTTWHEYSVEPTGTYNAAWIAEPGLRVWPQGGAAFQGEAAMVGRLGSSNNIGILYSKPKLAAPIPIATFDTNYATGGQRGLDWAMRCLFNVGDALWMGGSSRQDRNAGLFRYEVDEDGDIINPGATLSGVGGPVYSIAMLPYAASGASTTERIFISVGSATYYKDADGGADPTTDAAVGFVQLSDFDLGLEDQLKLLAAVEAFLNENSVDGKVEVQIRIDPGDPSEAWVALGDLDGANGFTHIQAPDDNDAAGAYGTRVRVLQARLVWTRPTSGTARDILDTFTVLFAEVLPLSAAS